jgi:prepilin-type processing-associated H-X9-DG protein
LAHLFPYFEQPFKPELEPPTTTHDILVANAKPSGIFIRNGAINDDYLVKTLICPSDGPKIHKAVDSSDSDLAMGNYLGVNAPNTDQRDPWNQNYQGVFVYWGHFTTDSPWGQPVWRSPTTMATISDGTSNTLMVGERPSYPDPAVAGGWQSGAWVYSEMDSALGLPNTKLWVAEKDQFGKPCPGGNQWFQPGNLRNGCDAHHYWSLHAGGGNWLFADGSVHFLAYNVGTAIQAALATKNGGEAVPGDVY